MNVLRRVLAWAVSLWVVLALVFPATASAHAVLIISTPAASSVLPKAPDRLELGFNESVDVGLSSVRLFDGEQTEVPIGRPAHAPNNPSVVVADLPNLGNGTYVVVWRVTSADGHPVSGAFPFEIGTTSSGLGYDLVESVVQAVKEKSPLGAPLAVARFVAFAGFMLLAGSVTLAWGTRHLGSGRVVLSALTGVVLSLAGALAVFLMQGAWVTGGGWADVFGLSSVGDVAPSRLGAALLARIVLVLLWFALVQMLRRSEWTSVTGIVAGLLLVLTAATFSFSGHPSAESNAWLWAPVDLVHMLAVGTWAGGVTVLVAARRDIESGPHGGLVLGRFSQSATVALPVAVVTGVAQSLHLTDGPSAWGDTRYGWFLAGKVALVAVVLLLGVRARRTVRAGRGSELGGLLRVEAVIAVLVLGLTAGLVSSSPREVRSTVESHSATLVEGNIIVEVSVVPPRKGTAEVHVLFSPPGGAITPVKDVVVRVALPSREVPAIPVDMTEIGANHWSGVVQFPYAGEWTLEILASPRVNAQVRYSTVIPVKD
ncbi:MAG: copper resistance CopC/CopD family protein [Ilumatobacteraceae bacterium]